jgi:hypothetical protein
MKSDENLVRADLSPAERAAHQTQRRGSTSASTLRHTMELSAVDTRGRVARVAILLHRRCRGTRPTC